MNGDPMKNPISKPRPQKQSSGFSITESLIAATILLASTNFTVQFFNRSNESLNLSKLSDYAHAIVENDLEMIRSNLSNWTADTSSATGMSSYSPPDAACQSRSLAKAFLNDPASSQATSYGLDLSQSPVPLQGLAVDASLSVDPNNANLLRVEYSSDASPNAPVQINQQALLLSPAQGWCS